MCAVQPAHSSNVSAFLFLPCWFALKEVLIIMLLAFLVVNCVWLGWHQSQTRTTAHSLRSKCQFSQLSLARLEAGLSLSQQQHCVTNKQKVTTAC